MSETKILPQGAGLPAETYVTVDGKTITGDGTAMHPLTAAGASGTSFPTTRANPGPLSPPGTAVAQSLATPDRLVLGNASALATSILTGLIATVPDPTDATVRAQGLLVLTTAQWDAVTGDVGGLVEGKPYYLSDTTSGHITQTAPVDAGSYQVIVGVALDATTMLVRIGTPIGPHA